MRSRGRLFGLSVSLLPLARMHSRGRVFGLSVSLFFRHFLACSHVQDTFKSSLDSKQVNQVKKVACRWSMIDRYGLEARKTLVLTRG